MAKLPTTNKNPGDPHTAAEYNASKDSLNALYDALFAVGVIGLVKDSALPPVYFTGVTGAGTQSNPYVVSGSGGQASAEDYLKALPGYSEIEDKVLYINAGAFSWGAVPSGNLEKLATPVLTIGAAAVDSFPLSWDVIINATSYTLQRDTQSSFASAITVYNGPLRIFTDSGLVANTPYYYRLRANAAGFTPSNFATGSKTTLATGNITPPSPSNAVIDDTADTFNWTNATGYASITNYEFTLNGGTTYAQATVKPLVIGNVAKAVGQVGVRVKADTGRNASGTLYNGAAFNTAAVKADKPTNPINNDTADTFDWTNVAGFNLPYQYEQTLDGGTTYTTVTEKPLYVGDFNKAIGKVGVRVKAATGVLASDTLFNTVAFTGTDGLSPVTEWVYVENFTLSGNTLTGANLGGAVSRARSQRYFPSGLEGSVQYTGYGRIGLDDNKQSDAYGQQFNYATFINSGNGRMYSNNGTTTLSPSPNVTIPSGVTPIVRARLTVDTVFFGYSTDGGTTWTEPNSTPRAAGDLYIKADVGYATNDVLGNILAAGSLVDSTVVE